MKSKKSISFSKQLKMSFIIIIIIPILCLGGFIFYSSYHYINQQRREECETLVMRSLKDLESWEKQSEVTLRYLTGNFSLQTFLQLDEKDYLEVNKESKSISTLLYNVLFTNQSYQSITVYTDKNYTVMDALLKNNQEVKNSEWYQEIMDSANTVWWNEGEKLFMGRKIVTSYPVQSIGIIVIELKPEKLAENFEIFQDVPVVISLEADNKKIANIVDHMEEVIDPEFEKTEPLSDTGWSIRYQIDKNYFQQNGLKEFGPQMVIICLVLIAEWFMISLSSKVLLQDLLKLVKDVNVLKTGNFDVEIHSSRVEEINVLSVSIQNLLNKIKQLIDQVYTKEMERQEMELNLLQSKISPHFLYNNLSAINWLALDCGEDQIYEITTELATFYRTALNQGRNTDRLSVEIANIKAYIHLQEISHEKKFEVEYAIDESLMNIIIPIFILQPLVENAIEHGIETLGEKKGKLGVKVYKEEPYLVLEIFDNGEELYHEIGEAELPQEKYGYGVSNIYKRLKLLYGDKVKFLIKATKEGTISIIKIPYKENINIVKN